MIVLDKWNWLIYINHLNIWKIKFSNKYNIYLTTKIVSKFVWHVWTSDIVWHPWGLDKWYSNIYTYILFFLPDEHFVYKFIFVYQSLYQSLYLCNKFVSIGSQNSVVRTEKSG